MAASSPGEAALIALGGNVGDVLAHFRAAREVLQAHAAVTVLHVSPVYRSPAIGPPQDDYLNAVLQLRTILAPLQLLDVLQAIEQQCRRVRKQHWGPRTLDLDLIDYAGQVYEDARLTLPHPECHQRLFVLQPLMDIAPHWQHPGLKQGVEQLMRQVVAEAPVCLYDRW